jgi:disulfide oxidoreductase YuzD
MFDYAAAAVTISLFAFLVSSMFVFICLRTGLFDTRKKPYGYKGKVVTYVSPAAGRGDLEEQQMDTATEETSLLGTYRKGDKIQEATVVGLAQPVTANSFYEYDLDIVDREFLEKFLRIMILGMRVKLHTTRGPREIIVTIVKDEMRWEQVRVKKDAPKKRYKLKFPDITDLEMGKATNTFINNAIAQDKCSLSVVTEKASLDIEADSTIERNCLFRGLQLIIRQIELAKEKDQNNVKK